MKDYIYSDLALEASEVDENAAEITQREIGSSKLLTLTIDSDELSRKYNRQKGCYITLSIKRIWLMDDLELEECASIIGEEISAMISSLFPAKSKSELSFLVVGLGNSDITPDAIGPLTVSHLTVTRHISSIDPSLFKKIGQCKVSAFIPGVLAQTGIDTHELVRGAVENVNPDVVVAVDALAARSCERLASTVQITDTGICPGSGIGNTRKELSTDTLGVPVISIGVPTVVDSATLVYDALTTAGINEISPELKEVLDNGKSFFVSPKECDVISQSVGILLANALDKAFFAG